MTATTFPTPSQLIRRGVVIAAVSAVVILFVLWKAGGSNPHYLGNMLAPWLHARPHGPDMALLSRQSPVILFHLAVAVSALTLGTVQLLARKGTLPHRVLGRIWLFIMASIAISGFFIQSAGHFSLIHIFSVVTLIIIPVIVWQARKGNIASHANWAMGLFIAALLVSGILAFMPGRLLWNVFFG
jgi:uncharacterized membrane protein